MVRNRLIFRLRIKTCSKCEILIRSKVHAPNLYLEAQAMFTDQLFGEEGLQEESANAGLWKNILKFTQTSKFQSELVKFICTATPISKIIMGEFDISNN